jgi:hypothetical protein
MCSTHRGGMEVHHHPWVDVEANENLHDVQE